MGKIQAGIFVPSFHNLPYVCLINFDAKGSFSYFLCFWYPSLGENFEEFYPILPSYWAGL